MNKSIQVLKRLLSSQNEAHYTVCKVHTFDKFSASASTASSSNKSKPIYGITYNRTSLANQLHLSNYDLRFRIKNHIYAKNDKILLNLNENKFIITKDKILGIDLDELAFNRHFNIYRKLREEYFKKATTQLSTVTDNVTHLPYFEFHALEFLLNFVITEQEKLTETNILMVKTLTTKAEAFYDENSKSLDAVDIVDDLATMRLLDDERDLIEKRVQENERLIELLGEITDDEEMLEEFLISVGKQRTEEKPEPTEIDLIDEMEQLLDIYLMKLQDINDTLTRLNSTIKSSSEIIQLKQDIFRNKIMLQNLYLNQLNCALVFVALIFGAFGMNMKFGFSESEYDASWPFWVVVGVGLALVPGLKVLVSRFSLTQAGIKGRKLKWLGQGKR